MQRMYKGEIIMLFFKKKSDGGNNSGVTGYWLIEIKWLFSIVLLKFEPNHRENYHSHAFNAVTLWLKGDVWEVKIDTKNDIKDYKNYKAGDLKYTPRSNMHKIIIATTIDKPAWAISFRGPWKSQWTEYNRKSGKTTTLTHGRKEVD